MNIFYLSHDNEECARWHCNAHVVKMITEYSQVLSTAHRVLDGTQREGKSVSGKRNTTHYVLPDEREQLLYRSSHSNHPSNLWTRESEENYNHLYCLFVSLSKEYEYRYKRVHLSYNKLRDVLKGAPLNINRVKSFTQPTPAMPEAYKVPNDSIESYKNFYRAEKVAFAKWTNRPIPEWMDKENAKAS